MSHATLTKVVARMDAPGQNLLLPGHSAYYSLQPNVPPNADEVPRLEQESITEDMLEEIEVLIHQLQGPTPERARAHDRASLKYRHALSYQGFIMEAPVEEPLLGFLQSVMGGEASQWRYLCAYWITPAPGGDHFLHEMFSPAHVWSYTRQSTCDRWQTRNLSGVLLEQVRPLIVRDTWAVPEVPFERAEDLELWRRREMATQWVTEAAHLLHDYPEKLKAGEPADLDGMLEMIASVSNLEEVYRERRWRTSPAYAPGWRMLGERYKDLCAIRAGLCEEAARMLERLPETLPLITTESLGAFSGGCPS